MSFRIDATKAKFSGDSYSFASLRIRVSQLGVMSFFLLTCTFLSENNFTYFNACLQLQINYRFPSLDSREENTVKNLTKYLHTKHTVQKENKINV